MQFTLFRALAVFALANSALGSPVARGQDGSLAARFEITPEGVEISPEDVVKTIEIVVDAIKGIDKLVHQHDVEEKFTESTIDQLRSTYNNKNAIIFSSQDSHTSFVNGIHTHYELDIGLGFTKGYEIWLLDSGSFDRAGDGGYINWCFAGNYHRDGGSSHVDFYPIGAPAPKKMRRDTQSITYDFKGVPGSNKTHTPLHNPVTYTPPPPPATANIPPSEPTCTKGTEDGMYFLNCNNANGTSALGLAYYKALSPNGGNKGQQPDDFTLLAEIGHQAVGNGTTASHDAWRFPVGAMEFEDTQTTVHWNLFGNAYSDTVSANQTAGTANNGQEQFWMFKDDGCQLFQKDQWTCNSLYYAF